MQKTVLEEIINAEKEAEKIIQQAREKADRIVSEADADYNSAILAAKEESQKKIQAAVLSAREKAQADYDSAVRDAEEENNRFLEKSGKRTEDVAGMITEMLLKPEYEKE